MPGSIKPQDGASMRSPRTRIVSHPREGGTLPDPEGAGHGCPAPLKRVQFQISPFGQERWLWRSRSSSVTRAYD